MTWRPDEVGRGQIHDTKLEPALSAVAPRRLSPVIRSPRGRAALKIVMDGWAGYRW